MKKLLFLLPLLVLFVACQPDDPAAESGRISFANQVEDLTRGDNTLTTTNLANFDVWGHNNNGVVFSGTRVEKQGDLWLSAEEKMWEQQQVYHFHAFAPAGTVENIGEYPNAEKANGLSNFAYTNDGDKDLIYAYSTRTQGSLLKINADPVQLTFEHLLSRVQFTFKNNLSEGNITISDVQIIDAAKSAELNCADADMANWAWNATATGAYNFGNTSVIAQGASAATENVQFFFPAATQNYNITFNLAYESEAAVVRTATIADVNLVMGKAYNINVTIEDKDIATEEYNIKFFVAEVKDWGSNIELNATLNGNPDTPGMENGHEYVDLGLSVKWATCNVGATTPDEYGYYFAWGEIEPKKDYSWDTYKYGTEDNITKYNSSDNKTILDPEDDAATVNWGGNWRMPTRAEQEELCNDCTWILTTQNGVNGYKVVGPNGNSIFLSVTGAVGSNVRDDASLFGFYWSSSSRSSFSSYAFGMSNDGLVFITNRYFGMTVRSVCE
ncbi:MAG: fimbrillin family protein [Paludibacteraceae bacterium]|nr:fimbrillin family protein [Paludibacteraceae bacterium]